MITVIKGVAVLGVLAAVFGLMLAVASRVFAVVKDPREEAIADCLPGANCGGCGYPGCGGYASAVVKGETGVTGCAPGGESVANAIAEIMGIVAGESVRMVAQVGCSGGGADKTKYEYIGVHDCLAAARLPGGGAMGCQYGCLGMGTCEKVCPFDAIHVVEGVAKVDEDACKACNKCVDTCPRHIIALQPFKTRRHVAIPCSSHVRGPGVTKVCANGCIACSLCVKACPKECISIVDNLAVIDYDLCVGCGLCAQKCPRKLITVDGVVPEVKPKPATA